MLSPNQVCRVVNVKKSFLLKTTKTVKNGDVVTIETISPDGLFAYCSNGFHIETSCLEPINSKLWAKAEILWHSLAYIKTMLDTGEPIDKDALEKILNDYRPALSDQ